MQTKHVVITVVAGVVVLAGLGWLVKSSPQGFRASQGTANVASSSGGALAAEETRFDFGGVSMAKGKVSHSFKLKNTGTGAVTVEKLYTSCMCTTAKIEVGGRSFGPYGMPGHGFIPQINKTMQPGEEATVEAIFDPNAHGPAGVGRVERVITIENSGEIMELQFAATVTP